MAGVIKNAIFFTLYLTSEIGEKFYEYFNMFLPTDTICQNLTLLQIIEKIKLVKVYNNVINEKKNIRADLKKNNMEEVKGSTDICCIVFALSNIYLSLLFLFYIFCFFIFLYFLFINFILFLIIF